MNKKLKILVLSQVAWDDKNSFGNSFSNIFKGISEIEIANIYCGFGSPSTPVVHSFFQVNEKGLIKNLLNSKSSSGQIVSNQIEFKEEEKKDLKKFKFFQKNRFLLFFWIRELIWFFGRWKSKELKKYVDDFQPDLIFLPLFYPAYMNKIGVYLKEYSGKKMIGYISDDHYSVNFSFLTFFNSIDRYFNRIYLKKAINQCELLYVISSIQKKEYDQIFSKNCKIVYKGANFTIQPAKREINKPIRFLYTGNLYAGRYNVLAEIGKVLSEKGKGELIIYTASPITNEIKNALNYSSIKLNGAIPYSEVQEQQKNADVLIHVESFENNNARLVRHSFSTKIVDYFEAGKCVFAAGQPYVASIDYLIENKAAIVATSINDIKNKIEYLVDNPNKINQLALQAWECGKKNHNISIIQSELLNDIKKIVYEI